MDSSEMFKQLKGTIDGFFAEKGYADTLVYDSDIAFVPDDIPGRIYKIPFNPETKEFFILPYRLQLSSIPSDDVDFIYVFPSQATQVYHTGDLVNKLREVGVPIPDSVAREATAGADSSLKVVGMELFFAWVKEISTYRKAGCNCTFCQRQETGVFQVQKEVVIADLETFTPLMNVITKNWANRHETDMAERLFSSHREPPSEPQLG